MLPGSLTMNRRCGDDALFVRSECVNCVFRKFELCLEEEMQPNRTLGFAITYDRLGALVQNETRDCNR